MFQSLFVTAIVLSLVIFLAWYFTPMFMPDLFDPEADIIKFIESTVQKNNPIALADGVFSSVSQELSVRFYLLQLLSKKGFLLADKKSFLKNVFEEQAVVSLGIVDKNVSFVKPEQANYKIAFQLSESELKLAIQSAGEKDSKTKSFKIPNNLKNILSKVNQVFPAIVDVKYRLEGNELIIGAIVNYPFTTSVSVNVNDKNLGVQEVKNEYFVYKIPDVKVGDRYEIALIPKSPSGKDGASFTNRFFLEPLPQTVSNLSYSIKGNKILYSWDDKNYNLQELKFKIETLKGVFYTENKNFAEDLELGRMYKFTVTAVAKFGESEPRSVIVKTPPSKPIVEYQIEKDTIKFIFKNTCDYKVIYKIKVGAQSYETSDNYFEFKIPIYGVAYTFEVMAADGTFTSEPVLLTIQTKAP